MDRGVANNNSVSDSSSIRLAQPLGQRIARHRGSICRPRQALLALKNAHMPPSSALHRQANKNIVADHPPGSLPVQRSAVRLAYCPPRRMLRPRTRAALVLCSGLRCDCTVPWAKRKPASAYHAAGAWAARTMVPGFTGREDYGQRTPAHRASAQRRHGRSSWLAADVLRPAPRPRSARLQGWLAASRGQRTESGDWLPTSP